MELIFPWFLYVGIVVLVILCILKFINRIKYKRGKRVANTGFVEETSLFKQLYLKYKILSNAAIICLLIAIATGFVLMSRPAKAEEISTDIRNRDIFICMDISDSVDELNVEMCDKLKEVVEELDGERFGITIFNAKSVLLVPLTTDYEYVMETLDKLKASFEKNILMSSPDYEYSMDDFTDDVYNYKYEGTLSYAGSSLIGDGLASCLYSFPDLGTNSERSRLIIFTTDNELNGTPYVTLEEAAKLCKKNDVKVFAVSPDNIVDEDTFKSSIEDTGGEYYRFTSSNVFDDLINDIEATRTSDMKKVEIRVFDQPQTLFICMLIFVSAYFLLSRKVKL